MAPPLAPPSSPDGPVHRAYRYTVLRAAGSYSLTLALQASPSCDPTLLQPVAEPTSRHARRVTGGCNTADSWCCLWASNAMRMAPLLLLLLLVGEAARAALRLLLLGEAACC